MNTAQDIALGFIEIANEKQGVISPLKVQKLLYYAQGWHLALEDSSLFEDDIEAWAHGPVCHAVYQDYKSWQWRPIDMPEAKSTLCQSTKDFLAKIWQGYGHFSGKALEEMTHIETPWKEYYSKGWNNTIPQDFLKTYFKSR